uniref:Ig-like domain-containing protein n=1 Tax=Lates calcarifer TaxID=8187 RepID=A0A4W6G3F4_LATCA
CTFCSVVLKMSFYTEVSCVFMESCILPCSFQSGADPVIHWTQVTAGHLPVHSYYRNKDQFGLQDQFFRNRTSLFKDQISRGNASLQLTGVEVQDQGRYRCYTSTMRGKEESCVNLRVDSMRDTQEIHKDICLVNMVGNRIICSSEGIYPEPDLTWSTRPPSNLNLQNQTSIQQTEQQLYNISSSLILSDSETDLIYICTISTRSNSRNTTWRKLREDYISPLSWCGILQKGKITFLLFLHSFLVVFIDDDASWTQEISQVDRETLEMHCCTASYTKLTC